MKFARINMALAASFWAGAAQAQDESVLRRMEERSANIQANPDDPRRPAWLAEQASDTLFELWPAQGLGLTALFGLPGDDELRTAREHAQRIHELAIEAEQAINQAIADLERRPGFADDLDAVEQRRALVEVERDRRIPFLRGAGALLAAELGVSQPTHAAGLHAHAAQRLAPLAQQMHGTVAGKAHWMAGLALLRIGRFDDAAANLHKAKVAAADHPSDLFAALICGVLLEEARSGPQAAFDELARIESRYATGDPAHAFFRVLIADQRFRLMRSRGSHDPAAIFGVYIGFLRENLGIARDAQRAIVLERLARAWSHVGESLPHADLPALVTIARAEHLAKAAQTREQAVILLEGLLSQTNVTGDDRASALFALGRTLHEHGRALFAAQRFIELAEFHSADAHAERAVELGTSIAADLVRRNPQDAEARDLLAHALRLLLEKYPNLPSIDRWRYAAGRLAMDMQDYQAAIERFRQVTPEAPQWLDANFMQAAAAGALALQLSDASRLELGSSERQQRAAAALDRVQRVRPILAGGLARAEDGARAGALRYYLAKLRIIEAEALLAMNRAGDALAALAGVENDAQLSGDIIGEALRVRIAAHQALGQPEHALDDLRTIVRAQPQQAATVLLSILTALERDMQELMELDRQQEAENLARRAAAPAAELLERWLASPAAASWDGAQRELAAARIAHAFRMDGQHEPALRWYDVALQTRPEALPLLLGRAECLFHLGGEDRHALAMDLYKRIAAAGPEMAAGDYWLAQVRMLQILDRVGRNTHQILPRIERLRQQQPDLGGGRYHRQFEALRRKYAS